MVSLRSGLATQILDKSPKAFLIHCFAHALNLSVKFMVPQIPFLDNVMSNSLEISNLIKLLPKQNALLDKPHKELTAEYPGFRTLCPTRWAVRRNSLIPKVVSRISFRWRFTARASWKNFVEESCKLKCKPLNITLG